MSASSTTRAPGTTHGGAHQDDEVQAPPEPFVGAVQRAAARMRHGRRLTFLQSLAMVGAVGWTVVLPAVTGAAVGHLLDGWRGGGTAITLVLLLAGLLLGCASAWRAVARELRG